MDLSVLGTSSFEDILDDLTIRFVINVPDEELAKVERIGFQVEQAHWFYWDFIRVERPDLPKLGLKAFSSTILFERCPLLSQWAQEHDKAYTDYLTYKSQVPVCGAIMLNRTMDKCVLVKGWEVEAPWGFPKGKINQNETSAKCAVREVLEETGYDISPLLRKNDHIEVVFKKKRIKLYIVIGVPEDSQFATQTRKEISEIAWTPLDDLPGFKTMKPQGPKRFSKVELFMSQLKVFLNHRSSDQRKTNHQGESTRIAKNTQEHENTIHVD